MVSLEWRGLIQDQSETTEFDQVRMMVEWTRIEVEKETNE